MDLIPLGWSDFFRTHFINLNDQNLSPGRILEVHRSHFLVATAQGPIPCEWTGNFLARESRLPTVGDWVALTPFFQDSTGNPRALLQNLLPREIDVVILRRCFIITKTFFDEIKDFMFYELFCNFFYVKFTKIFFTSAVIRHK